MFQLLFQLPSPGTIGLNENLSTLGKFLGKLWSIAIPVAATVFMILLLIGGIQYLTATGNQDLLTKAKSTLLNATIGLVLVLLAWPVGTWLLNALFS